VWERPTLIWLSCNNLFRSAHSLGAVNSRMLLWVERTAHIEDRKLVYFICVQKSVAWLPFWRASRDRRIILDLTSGKLFWGLIFDWTSAETFGFDCQKISFS
jgi:hypothetical protein